MKRFFSISVAATLALSSFLIAGCSAESSPKEDKQVVQGKLDGQSGTKTQAVTVSGQGQTTHVIAHQLTAKGEPSRVVVSDVGADGSFHLELERGARYVLEIERAGASVAILGFASKKSGKKVDVLPIASSTAGKASVSVGRVHVAASGKGAAVEVSPLESFDELDVTGLPSAADHQYFVTADGAIASAEEALAAAEKALEEAEKAIADAQKQASDAEKQAQAAKDAANAAGGGTPKP